MNNIQTTVSQELFIKMVLSNWELQISRFNNFLAKISDDELSASTAPGRNTGVYLLGHLAAITDAMFTLLDLGERIDPAMDAIFIHHPENAGLEKPSIAELRAYWNNVEALLAQRIEQTSADNWFTRHTAISEVDFAKEPHRNKLNIMINRTNHFSYHLGQLNYLVKK